MQVLLGGLVTLAVTAVVQILIIPWVQRRNRRRERWERDVIELETLLHHELRGAIDDAERAAQDYRGKLLRPEQELRVEAEGVKPAAEASGNILRTMNLRLL